jgi:hypothetical protein
MQPSDSDNNLPLDSQPNAQLSAEQERELRRLDEQERRIEVTVVSIVPELGVAVVRSSEGHELRIRHPTAGVNWEDVQPGQRLVLLVKGVLAPRVLSVVGTGPDK